MTKKKTTKIRIGDIFQIPIDSNHAGYGHVVAECRPIFYMVAYDLLSSAEKAPPTREIVQSPILFLGNFFDVLIANGHWKVVGNELPDFSRIPFPSYRVKIKDDYYAENWDGTKRRQATEAEILLLDFRGNSAPMYLEVALKAYFGNEKWETDYDQFTLPYVAARSKIDWLG